jgi:hypothetical protein
MEVQAMEMTAQRTIFGIGTINTDARANDGSRAQPAGGVSASGKQSVPSQYDQLIDLESTRLMEERYGIREEGIF